MSNCRWCNAEVKWIVTERNRKNVPLNSEPVMELDDEIAYFNEQGRSWRGKNVPPGEVVYLSHFKTCVRPDAPVAPESTNAAPGTDLPF